MKKTFFNPANVRFAKKMPSRLARFGSACYREDGDVAAERAALITEIRSMITDGIKGKLDASALDAAVEAKLAEVRSLRIDQLRSLTDDKTGALAKIEALALQMESIRTSIVTGKGGMSARDAINSWRTENKQLLEDIRNRKKVDLPVLHLQVRVADSPMLPSTVYNGDFFITRTEVQSGVVDIPRRRPTFWDFIKKGRTSGETIVWVNKVTPDGAADFIGPGVTKPSISFKLAKAYSNAKKIAAKEKIATELLYDIEGFNGFVTDEMRYKVFDELNQKLMTGVLDAETPAGVRTLSTVFPVGGGGLSTTDPNEMDSIRSTVAYLRSGLLTGEVTVFVNSIDAGNMDMRKSSLSGVYLLPPFVTADGRKIGGATIIEDTNIPVGYFQAGFMDYYVVKVYQDYFISFGWENSDFGDNLITAIGEMRLHQIFNTQFTGAFIYDTYENVKTAIAAP